jgi:hypothetical protein
MGIPENVGVALVAGTFGLIPIILQWIATYSQRRDRIHRLDNLRAELEFLERLSAFQGKIGDGENPIQSETKLRVENAVSDLLDQYSALPKDIPSAPAVPSRPSTEQPSTERPSAERPPPPPVEQHSLFRRVFLLYQPETPLGWVWHTLFYILMSIFLTLLISDFFNPTYDPETGANEFWYLLFGLAFLEGIPLLVLQRLARYEARKSQLPDSP